MNDQNDRTVKDNAVPAHSQEWHEGWNAFENGKDLSDNPYMADSQSRYHMRWELGWKAARYQNSK